LDQNLINRKTEKSHKDLKVYKLSYDLGLQIHKKSVQFPEIEKFTLAQQLRTSAMSIPANIAEGMTRQSSTIEIARFLRIALGSSSEVIVWLNYAYDLGYIDNNEFENFTKKCNEIGKMLQGLIKYYSLK